MTEEQKITQEQKIYIDSLSVYKLLHRVRFAPTSDPMLQGDVGNYWLARLATLREQDPGEYVVASKQMGWKK